MKKRRSIIYAIVLVSCAYGWLSLTSTGIYLGPGKPAPLDVDGYTVDKNGIKREFGMTTHSPTCDYFIISELRAITTISNNIYMRGNCPLIYSKFYYFKFYHRKIKSWSKD